MQWDPVIDAPFGSRLEFRFRMPVQCVIQDGDSVIKLSEQYGFAAETIWSDSANASLKKSRPDMNVLVPGDVVVIPDKKVKQEKRPTGKRHKFRRKGIPALFRLQLFDGDSPRKNQDYQLTGRRPAIRRHHRR